MTLTEKLTDSDIKKYIESAMNTALVVLHFNGVTSMADKALRNILRGAGIKGVNTVWRIDNIMVSYRLNGQPEMMMKPVLSIGTSLNGLDKVMEFSEDVKTGKVPLENVNAELNKILALPLIHKRMVYILLDGLAAAFYLKFHHGNLVSILIVLLAAMTGESVRYMLQSKAVPGNRIMFICGIISTGITGLFLHYGYGTMEITTLIASIIYLVPGLRMINGFIDLTSLKYTFIGAQRLLNAMYLLLILALVILISDAFIRFSIL